MVGGLVALVLLISGELSLSAFPVRVTLEVRGGEGLVQMDGGVHAVSVPQFEPGARIVLEQPGPVQREYQIDGSDTTARDDRNVDEFRATQGTPWYRVLGWLRDESRYSRWVSIQLSDLADGHVLATGADAVQQATLPAAFRLEASPARG